MAQRSRIHVESRVRSAAPDGHQHKSRPQPTPRSRRTDGNTLPLVDSLDTKPTRTPLTGARTAINDLQLSGCSVSRSAIGSDLRRHEQERHRAPVAVRGMFALRRPPVHLPLGGSASLVWEMRRAPPAIGPSIAAERFDHRGAGVASRAAKWMNLCARTSAGFAGAPSVQPGWGSPALLEASGAGEGRRVGCARVADLHPSRGQPARTTILTRMWARMHCPVQIRAPSRCRGEWVPPVLPEGADPGFAAGAPLTVLPNARRCSWAWRALPGLPVREHHGAHAEVVQVVLDARFAVTAVGGDGAQPGRRRRRLGGMGRATAMSTTLRPGAYTTRHSWPAGAHRPADSICAYPRTGPGPTPPAPP